MRIRVQKDKPMRIHADPEPGQTLRERVEFYMKNLLKVDTVNGQKHIPMKVPGRKPF